MHRRQPLPRLWMMTDERQGEHLWGALERLPRRAGVVFRHYRLDETARQRLFGEVKAVARRRGLLLLLAGPPKLAEAWGADGAHGRFRRLPGTILTAPAHNLAEIRAAEHAGASLLFVSPAYPTRSHPGEKSLGLLRLGLLARQTYLPVVALGGMNRSRGTRLAGLGLYGWAGIDCWSRS